MSLSRTKFHFAGWACEVVDDFISKYLARTTKDCAQNQANGNSCSHAPSLRNQANPATNDRSHYTSNGETPEGSDPSSFLIFGKLDALSTVWTSHFQESSCHGSLHQDGEKPRVNLSLAWQQYPRQLGCQQGFIASFHDRIEIPRNRIDSS